MAKNLPTQAPKGVRRRTFRAEVAVSASSFNSVWPKMVADKYANPELTKRQIAMKYQDGLGLPIGKVMSRMSKAGWDSVVESVTKVSSQTSLASTNELIKSLDAIREKKGKKHLKKMMRYIDSAHTVIDSMAEDNERDVEAAKKNLPSFLSNVSATEALGRKVFNIDKQDKDAPSTVLNLAILTRFDP